MKTPSCTLLPSLGPIFMSTLMPRYIRVRNQLEACLALCFGFANISAAQPMGHSGCLRQPVQSLLGVCSWLLGNKYDRLGVHLVRNKIDQATVCNVCLTIDSAIGASSD
uniref:Uncharacterized protein n=1 Tax=Hanusia phi TaxID=3032 RepID=A0A7S0HR84_9CRYP